MRWIEETNVLLCSFLLLYSILSKARNFTVIESFSFLPTCFLSLFSKRSVYWMFCGEDEGDIVFDDIRPANAFTTIQNAISRLLKNDHRIITLGGDHSVSYPVIDAFSEHYKNLHVLHLDAHCDLYENFDNNPFSHASPFARIMEQGRVQSLTQVGIRTLNTHQQAQAKKFGVTIIEMKDFNYEFIEKLASPLYISLDLDVLDPAFAPGVSHHEPGGLSARELLTIIQKIKVPVTGADIVEYNPIRDINNMTAMVAYKLMKELISIMTD